MIKSGAMIIKSASTNAPIDWPVNLIFYGPGAEVDSVKRMLYAADLDHSFIEPSPMHLRLQDHPRAVAWDSDKGVKEWTGKLQVCQSPAGPYTGYHARIYADSVDDVMDNTNWYGGFVAATSHRDVNEGCSDRDSYGYSESAEGWIAGKLEASQFYNLGIRVSRSVLNLKNAGDSTDGERVMKSDGYATLVYMPKRW